MDESQDRQADLDQLEAQLKALSPKAVSADVIDELDSDYLRCRDRAEARAFEHRKSVRRVFPIAATTVGVFACYLWVSHQPTQTMSEGGDIAAEAPRAGVVGDTKPLFSEDELREILAEELSIEQPGSGVSTPGFLPASGGRFD